MNPASYKQQLAEIESRLAIHNEAFINAQVDLDAARAEIQSIEEGWSDMLVQIALGRSEDAVRAQARARLRDLRHDVSDGEILIGELQHRIRTLENRYSLTSQSLRDAEDSEHKCDVEANVMLKRKCCASAARDNHGIGS